MGRSYDVAVAGLGVMGAAVAEALARRGLAVVGLDARHPPHDAGSSHGGSRIVRTVYFEDPLYVPYLERARRGWDELERRAGERLLVPTGGLTLGPEDGELVRGARASAERHRLAHELLDATAVRRRFPGLAPTAAVAVFDPEAGVLRPERSVEALLALAARAGAELRPGRTVTGWRETAGGVALDTADGPVKAGRLVVAAGAWLGELVPEAAQAIEVERAVQHWFAPAAAGLFGPERLPVFVWELDDGRIWYGLPDLGDGLKVAMHYRGERARAPGGIRREVDPAEFAGLADLLDRFAPAVGESVEPGQTPVAAAAARHLRSSVCLYTCTSDLHFLIDRHPAAERVVLVSACSGHGFKFAPAVGELVAEWLADGRPSLDLAPFRWRWPV